MGPFPSSYGHLYILLAVDYVFKWVEAIPTRTNDHKVVLKFLKEHIFFSFRNSSVIICDGGSIFVIGCLIIWSKSTESHIRFPPLITHKPMVKPN